MPSDHEKSTVEALFRLNHAGLGKPGRAVSQFFDRGVSYETD